MENESKWMAVMLRQKYNSEKQKQEMWNKLKNYYGKSSGDIYMISKNVNEGLSFYVFIRENNPSEFWNKIKKDKYFQQPMGYYEVTDKQIKSLTREIEYKRDTVFFGDIVKIKTGQYQKLYGIVLRQSRAQKIEVGLKFCFGSIYQEYNETDLEVIGNIFKFIKINK